MKAITLHQPWATLIAEGVKTIETRSWAPSGYGNQRVAIHAAATKRPARKLYENHFPLDDKSTEAVIGGEMFDITKDVDWHRHIPYGAIVATATIGPAFQMPLHSLPFMAGKNRRFREYVDGQRPWGDFSDGRWLWVLEDVCKLPEPIPARGWQRFWEVPQGIVKQLIEDGVYDPSGSTEQEERQDD